MPNRWVEWVKEWSLKNNLSYGCALTKKECSIEYKEQNKKIIKPKRITKRQFKKFSENYIPLEETSIIQTPINKDIQIQRKSNLIPISFVKGNIFFTDKDNFIVYSLINNIMKPVGLIINNKLLFYKIFKKDLSPKVVYTKK